MFRWVVTRFEAFAERVYRFAELGSFESGFRKDVLIVSPIRESI
jgi:hypothetical protein